MVFFLVGLQNIETDIFEAAEVDGASQARKFFAITLPLLVPVILFCRGHVDQRHHAAFRRAEHPHVGGRSRQCDDDGCAVYLPAGISPELGLRLRQCALLRDRRHRGHPGVHPDQAPGKRAKVAVIRYGSFGRFILWILLLIGAFLCLSPSESEMAIGTTLNPNDVVRGVIVPGREFSLNLAKAVKNNNLLLYFFNSMKIALLTVLFGVSVEIRSPRSDSEVPLQGSRMGFCRPPAGADHSADRVGASPVPADRVLQAPGYPRGHHPPRD